MKVRSETDKQIRAAIGGMPFMGDVALRYPPNGEEFTLTDLAMNLGMIKTRLESLSETVQKDQAELQTYRDVKRTVKAALALLAN